VHQAAFADLIRRRGSEFVVVADIFHRFDRIPREVFASPVDDAHFTSTGHELLASVLVEAIDALLARNRARGD
jgi:hypothetical protein